MYPITVVLVHNMPAGPGVLVPGPDADNPMPIGNGFGSHEKDSVFAHHFKGVLREGFPLVVPTGLNDWQKRSHDGHLDSPAAGIRTLIGLRSDSEAIEVKMHKQGDWCKVATVIQ